MPLRYDTLIWLYNQRVPFPGMGNTDIDAQWYWRNVEQNQRNDERKNATKA